MSKIDDRIRYVTGEPPKPKHTGCWIFVISLAALVWAIIAILAVVYG